MKSDGRILLAHGSGGRMTQELVAQLFGKALSNPILDRMDDAASLDIEGRIAFTVDSHVVSPIFFPGGDIGRLSMTGTINDLAMVGARPLYITAGFIIEEGFLLEELVRIVASMRDAADEAGVQVVAGDTKVVERGAADGVFITTSGVGSIPDGVRISGSNARPGDIIIVSGTIGDHGATILSKREGMDFEVELQSDCAPLGRLVEEMLAASSGIHVLRDPTRGGVAATLNEIAVSSGVDVEIEEEKIPYRGEVRAACELLGLDPLVLANEGKLVAFVAENDAAIVLETMRASRYGADAAVIGRVAEVESSRPRVYARTLLGSRRILSMPTGEQLPRIC
ncbi:MAG: hydrogenase expression/formation protein HypE [Thermoleophilia bacterium]|nr:hydrogenase expression/formation protein HypE [Thermoleophilia bacterium]